MFTAIALVEIARPPDVIFAFLVDPATWPRWVADMKRIEGPSPMKTGDRFEEVTLFRGDERRCLGEVVLSEPPARFVLRLTKALSGPDVRPTRTFTLASIDRGTRVEWRNDVEVHGAMRLATPVLAAFFRKKMEDYLAALRREVERDRV